MKFTEVISYFALARVGARRITNSGRIAPARLAIRETVESGGAPVAFDAIEPFVADALAGGSVLPALLAPVFQNPLHNDRPTLRGGNRMADTQRSVVLPSEGSTPRNTARS